MRLAHVFIFVVLIGLCYCQKKLEFVQAIWRHGDRAPTSKPYPTDLNDESKWPRGWGQLTNIGMNQLNEVGQFFRSQYGNIISDHYVPEEVYIRSSDTDRALVSAQAMLSGLYPAQANYQWNTGSSWQPIAVHAATPGENDLLCKATFVKCKNAEQIIDAGQAQDEATYDKEYADVWAVVGNATGMPNFGYKDSSSIYDTTREIIHNLTQPSWVEQTWPTHNNKTTLDIGIECRTKRMLNQYGSYDRAHFYGGYLLNDFIQNAMKVANGSQTPKRFLGYSSHDTNIMAFQSTIGVQNGMLPTYACIMIMEIYSNKDAKNNTVYEAEFYYRNDSTSVPVNVGFPKCGNPCLVSNLADAYKDSTYTTPDQVQVACGNVVVDNGSNTLSLIAIVAALISIRIL